MKTTTLLLALTLTAGLAFAQDEPEQRRHRGPQLDQLQQTLGLSDTQLQALRENSAAMRQAIREALEGTRESREAMREEMRQDDPNEAVIAEHLAAMSETRQAVEAIRSQYRDSALAILDETQKAKLAEIEEALQLARLAPGAAALNLIEGPDGFKGRRGFGPGPHGPHGPEDAQGPRGPREPRGPRGPAPDVE